MKTLLFSIPMYNAEPSKIKQRIKEYCENIIKKYDGISDIIHNGLYTKNYGSKTIIENYIIGYLKIYLNVNVIEYETLLMTSNYENGSIIPYNMRLFTGKKHYLKSFIVNGMHTPIVGLSDEKIYQTILQDIKIISKSKWKNVFYDISLFTQYAQFIKFNELFKTINNKGVL